MKKVLFSVIIFMGCQLASVAQDAQTFRIVGEGQADADAVRVLKESLNVAEDGKAVRLVVGERGDKAVKAYKKQIPARNEGFYLKVSPKEVVIAGNDESGTFYGVQTFLDHFRHDGLKNLTLKDWPSVSCRGVIEGFYGNPWTQSARLRQFEFYGRQKMNTYVYGPKDDPFHRARWREAYPEAEASKIRELVEVAKQNKVQFVWALSPGGDIKWNRQDSMAVVKKLTQMYDLGVRTFALFFDDISGEGTKADKQAGLLNYITDNFVRTHEGVNPLIMCPTEYNKAWSGSKYLPTLGSALYPEIRIMWTGNSVVDMIEKDDMEWVNKQIGRKAFIWLNYPVNDYCQSRLLMGKTYGNGLDIADMVSGFCSNPMEYAEASKVSLFSIGEYTWSMKDYDSEKSWNRALDELMPTAREAFRFFCENNVDMGKNGHGLRRSGESPEFTEDCDKEAYFARMSKAADELLADSVNHPEMIGEIAPWVRSMDLLGIRGRLVLKMERAKAANDTESFSYYNKLQQAVEDARKAILSRNFKGSIVKANPVVSGEVVAPWIDRKVKELTGL